MTICPNPDLVGVLPVLLQTGRSKIPKPAQVRSGLAERDVELRSDERPQNGP